MTWGMVAVAGASLISGAMASNASKKAGDKAAGAANAAGARSDAQYADTQTNLQPYMDAGTQALGQYQDVMSGNYSNFNQSPDYLYALESGNLNLKRKGSATGNNFGGGADADAIRLGQGLATQNLGNYMQRLMGIAGLGQNSAVSLGQFGAQNVTNQGNALTGAANAQGAAGINSANAWGQAINGVVGAANGYIGNRQSQYAAPAQSNQQWGNFQPQQQGWNAGTLGPSNGSTWNFG